MIESLANLIALQKTDANIGKLKSSAEKIEREISELEKTVVQSQQEYDLLLQKIEDNQKKRRKKERDLDIKENELKKYKGQLFQVKTNREYEAMIEEISKVETDIGVLEEDILRSMEAGDNLSVESEEKKKQMAREKREVQNIMSVRRTELAEIEKEFKIKGNEQPVLFEKLEQNYLIEYKKLIMTRQGVAVVTAKNCVCSGCYISMRPQMFEELKRNDRIFNCPNCSRFLYWDYNR